MASAREANSTQVVLPVPTAPNGYQAGDLMIAFVYVGYDQNYDESTPIVAPDGWTEIDQGTVAHPSITSGGAGDQVAAFYRLSTGTEPANYQFEWAAGAGNAGFVGRIIVYRNVDQVAPLTSGGFVLSSGISDEPVSLDVPFNAPGARRLVCAWMAMAQDVTFVTPTVMTPRTQHQDNVFDYNIIGDFGETTELSIRLTLSVSDQSLAAAELDVRTASIQTTSEQSDGDRFVWGIAILVNPAT